MPRAPKPAGTAVDPRNGARITLPSVPLKRFVLPKRSDGLKYDVRTTRMWKSLWDDARLSAALSPVDRELVIRWAESVDDWIKATGKGRLEPVTEGSMGQEVASPHFTIAAQALAVAERCEAQIGIGALNRARLGIALLTEARSLQDLSAGFPGDGGGVDGDEPDPRLS